MTSESIPAQSKAMVPASQRERAETSLEVKPRSVPQKVTADLSVQEIMVGVMFFHHSEGGWECASGSFILEFCYFR